MPGPLDGIRVIDVTTVLLGPYGTQILGDMGADVIKVEAPPTGDIARNMGRCAGPAWGASSSMPTATSARWRSTSSTTAPRRCCAGSSATADVFVHNMRPQAIERLGFDYPAVSAIKPDIVYVGAYGFGQAGPYRAKPAYDDAIQAASGLASLFAMRDGTPQYVPAAIADKLVGVTLSQAVAMALLHRERTGRGQFVEVPMFEVLVSFNLVEHINGAAFEPPIGPLGYQRVTTASRRPFPTRDGYVCILPYSDKQWLRLLHRGRPSGDDGDPGLRDLQCAGAHRGRALRLRGQRDAGEDHGRVGRDLRAGEIPCMPVADIQRLMDDEHLKAVGMFERHEHPSEGETILVRPPVTFSASPADIRRHAPRFGEHGEEVARELGYDEASIADLLASGALIPPS